VVSLQKWTAPLVLALMSLSLLAALGNLLILTGSIAAGIAVSASFTILAACLTRTKISTGLLQAAPWSLGAGVLIALAGGPVTGTLCWAVIAGLGMTAFGFLAQRGSPVPPRQALFEEGEQLPGVAPHLFEQKGPHLPIEQISSFLPDEPREFELVFADENEEFEPLETASERDSLFTQNWSRSQSAGEERLEGVLVAELAAFQKHSYLHVPFIPFFQSCPSGSCECECDTEDDVQVELDLIHPYGARISIRRRGACTEPARVLIHLFVAAEQLSVRAA